MCRWSTFTFKNMWVYCPGHAGVKGNDLADKTGGQGNPHKWLASRKIWSVEKLEALPAGTKPRTWHHRSPGGERRWKRHPRRSSLKGRERAIVSQTSDEHWNRFKGNVRETSETEWSAYGLFRAHRYHLELNWGTGSPRRPPRLSHSSWALKVRQVQCRFTSTETIRTIGDGEPRTGTSTFAPELW